MNTYAVTAQLVDRNDALEVKDLDLVITAHDDQGARLKGEGEALRQSPGFKVQRIKAVEV